RPSSIRSAPAPPGRSESTMGGRNLRRLAPAIGMIAPDDGVAADGADRERSAANAEARHAAGRSLPMHLNSIALIAGKMATMGVGFLAWLVAARLFAPADVGLAAGAVSAMMLCVQLALFGAGAAIISLYPQHQQRPAALLD